MKHGIALLAVVFAGSAAAQTPDRSPTQPSQKPFVFEMPKDKPGAKKAPPGEICLLQLGDDRCPQKAELVRKPYEPGDGDLYLLDQQAGKTKTSRVGPPMDNLPKEKAHKLEAESKEAD